MSKEKKIVIPKESIENQKKTLGDGLRAKQKELNKSIKRSSVMYLQPDICKDFYETGYCGYGDNCKFIHDRSLTKTSLVQDREWEENRKREAAKSLEDLKKELDEEKKKAEEEKEKEEQNKKCPICKEEYNEDKIRMSMKCNHIVCSDCVIGLKKCPLCNAATNGVFKAVKAKK